MKLGIYREWIAYWALRICVVAIVAFFKLLPITFKVWRRSRR